MSPGWVRCRRIAWSAARASGAAAAVAVLLPVFSVLLIVGCQFLDRLTRRPGVALLAGLVLGPLALLAFVRLLAWAWRQLRGRARDDRRPPDASPAVPVYPSRAPAAVLGAGLRLRRRNEVASRT